MDIENANGIIFTVVWVSTTGSFDCLALSRIAMIGGTPARATNELRIGCPCLVLELAQFLASLMAHFLDEVSILLRIVPRS